MNNQEAIERLEHLRMALPLPKNAEEVIALEAAIGAMIPPPNDPLTLEELQEMDGEPVWCEIFVKGHTSFYGIIRGDIVAGYSPGNPNPTNLEAGERGGYGLAWLAYRRKPEEGER